MAKQNDRTPKMGYTPINPKEVKAPKDPETYLQNFVSWQIGNIDLDSNWHAHIMHSRFKFMITDEITEMVMQHHGNNSADAEAINKCLEELNNKEFNTIEEFIHVVNYKSACNIPNELTHSLAKSIQSFYFWHSIYPKMKSFESMTWAEVAKAVHGKKGKSSSHFIPTQSLGKEARDRLTKLKLDDVGEVYSLRLEGTLRIFGIRQFGYLKILWFDENHEVYPVD